MYNPENSTIYLHGKNIQYDFFKDVEITIYQEFPKHRVSIIRLLSEDPSILDVSLNTLIITLTEEEMNSLHFGEVFVQIRAITEGGTTISSSTKQFIIHTVDD